MVAHLRTALKERGHQVVTASELAAVTEQAPATAVFLSPDPEDTPFVSSVVPEPAKRAKKGWPRTSACEHRVPSGAWCKTCQAVKA
jgi:hypothetical protein